MECFCINSLQQVSRKTMYTFIINQIKMKCAGMLLMLIIMKHISKYAPYFLCLLVLLQNADAAVVDTVSTYSSSMKKTIKAVIITPDNYGGLQALPVVYLLHGYSGNYSDWVIKAKGFEKAADQHQMIIVCPDGGFGSWYWNSPVDANYKYETYVSN